MSEVSEAIDEAVDKARESGLNTIVATAVAVTATFIALCNVKDGNIVQAMAQAQANSVDSWAHYQAKSTKQHLAEEMVDIFTIQRDATTNLNIDGRALLEKKIIEYTAYVTIYEGEKGEIRTKAEAYQKLYDELNIRDDQFDMAEASLSISVALFGVTALTQKKGLLLVAGGFAAFGFVLGFAGFLGWDLHPEWLAKLLT
jgi:hypothetical protein